MTRRSPRPAIRYDADEADVLEQQQSVATDDEIAGDIDMDLPDGLPLDADPADVIDQHLSVPVDDDGRRT